ncbi:phosphonate ABC transporter ATP-binding protein [Salsuginibacillus kocurii]|uniref:phosphonate ABC transporter ATP-binding protein n=1 Tax=Salsuginibacillus kocurii TaxID=427078 RepID=UPI000365FA16|nr:phosphonate ABC transporter ATP-binding protein [Salsuginibacillus kocurii]
MLTFENVTVQYPHTDSPALSNFNLEIGRGEFVCVLGRSGAGKSTLIRTINALQPVSDGKVFVEGQNIHQLNHEDIRNVRAKIGMIFQHFSLVPRMTVFHNVLTGRFGKKSPLDNLLGRFTAREKQGAEEALRLTGIHELKDRRVEALSGGQKQRVGISRALMQRPEIFLGDEPVASLDPSTSDEVFRILWDLHEKQNLLTIINVHDLQLAKNYATRIIGLKEGELVFDGTPQELDEANYQVIYGEHVSMV